MSSIYHPLARQSKPESSRHPSRQQSVERESRCTTKTVQHNIGNVDTPLHKFHSRKVSISSNQESHVHNVSYQHDRHSIMQPIKFNHMPKPMNQLVSSLTQKSNLNVPNLIKQTQGGFQKSTANVSKGPPQPSQMPQENSSRYRKPSMEKDCFLEPPKPKVIHQQHVQSLTQPANPQVQPLGSSTFQKRPANHSGQRLYKLLPQCSGQPYNSQQEPTAVNLNTLCFKNQSLSSIKKKFDGGNQNLLAPQQPQGTESIASLVKFKA